MTAATVRLGRRRPVPLAGAGRLLRIEVRRNGMRVLLPLLAARATGFRMGNPVATLHRQPLTPALNGSGDALLSPSGGTPSIRIGVYYPYLPDLAIAQLLLLAGLTVAVLGVLGL